MLLEFSGLEVTPLLLSYCPRFCLTFYVLFLLPCFIVMEETLSSTQFKQEYHSSFNSLFFIMPDCSFYPYASVQAYLAYKLL